MRGHRLVGGGGERREAQHGVVVGGQALEGMSRKECHLREENQRAVAVDSFQRLAGLLEEGLRGMETEEERLQEIALNDLALELTAGGHASPGCSRSQNGRRCYASAPTPITHSVA